ncbi:hypothetical protein AOQ84DRAFT_360109 [Glonium stellatum]|uniref:Uncharacterized protein n=1 Tax=Glonium stellatum TaxID=574774 RepID=A0A8E2JX81_9PEZI|nr:hypothetical protein AOQ84DRAFT_360109 [Glonium stellatum]
MSTTQTPSASSRQSFPFNQIIHYGIYNLNHMTNLSFVYPSNVLPTPWPWLAGSFGLSILLTLIGIITATPDALKPESSPTQGLSLGEKLSRILSSASIILSMVRAIAAIVISSYPTENTLVPSSTAIVLILFSISAYPLTPGFGKTISILVVLSVFFVIALFILFVWKYYLGGNQKYFYSRDKLVGGTYPRVVKKYLDPHACSPKFPLEFGSDGCPSNWAYPDQPSSLGSNITTPECTVGLFGVVYAAFYLIILLLLCFSRRSFVASAALRLVRNYRTLGGSGNPFATYSGTQKLPSSLGPEMDLYEEGISSHPPSLGGKKGASALDWQGVGLAC